MNTGKQTPAALGVAAESEPAGETQEQVLPCSLGDRRKCIAAADLAKGTESAENIVEVRAFFTAAWGQFTANVDKGVAPGRVVLELFGKNRDAAWLLATYKWSLPPGTRWQDGGRGIWNGLSTYRRQWDEFLEGCRENGLEPVWTPKHDEWGVRAWWELTVEAGAPAVLRDNTGRGIMGDIGSKLLRSGHVDSFGARQLIHAALEQGEFILAGRLMGIPKDAAQDLWTRNLRAAS